MGIINRLDEHLSNMIAAGEVVERPMGIVKELVENCIDAKAKNIDIQITQGGIESITIIDDGIGMDAQDATLAFERHATSKLKEVNDLWNIHTMGFRGEALPSIASVSNVLLRTNNGVDATEVEIKYGALQHAKPAPSPKGTMIEVKNLFQKTPARFKHLKSPQYEFSLISDVVQKFALAHPEIAFHLSHDGRTIFQTAGNGALLEVIMQIYGREGAKTAIAIDTSDQDYELHGYILQPNFQRATKYYMLLYINERMIRSYRLQKAILDAYAPYLPKDKYPIVVLNIKMDAQLVDVNVHPSKWEIRLSKEKQLENLIYKSIDDALKESFHVNEVAIPKPKEKVEMQSFDLQYQDPQRKKISEEINESFAHPEKLNMREIEEKIKDNDFAKNPEEDVIKVSSMIKDEENSYPSFDVKRKAKHAISQDESNISQEVHTIEDKIEETITATPFKQEDTVETLEIPVENYREIEIQEEIQQLEAEPKNQSLPQMQVIGQFHNCYIIAQGEEGLYIIDQHAAQERYHYEVIKHKIELGQNETQPLLVPLQIESTIGAVSMVSSLNEALACLGITLEVFGESTFICRELPLWTNTIDEKAFLQDIIDIWLKDQEIDETKLRKAAIATMACHSSIRFNRSLTIEEMKQVIADLGKCEQPFHCPHGRPTFICLSDQHLFKEFQRGG